MTGPDDPVAGPRMRLDVVTAFPDYLSPLRLALPGRAIDRGILDLRVHDLRAQRVAHRVDECRVGPLRSRPSSQDDGVA